MNEDTTYTGFDEMDTTDSSKFRTYTQVVSCAIGGAADRVERQRQSLRAKLEREQFERQKQLGKSFSSTFFNLFRVS